MGQSDWFEFLRLRETGSENTKPEKLCKPLHFRNVLHEKLAKLESTPLGFYI